MGRRQEGLVERVQRRRAAGGMGGRADRSIEGSRAGAHDESWIHAPFLRDGGGDVDRDDPAQLGRGGDGNGARGVSARATSTALAKGGSGRRTRNRMRGSIDWTSAMSSPRLLMLWTRPWMHQRIASSGCPHVLRPPSYTHDQMRRWHVNRAVMRSTSRVCMLASSVESVRGGGWEGGPARESVGASGWQRAKQRDDSHARRRNASASSLRWGGCHVAAAAPGAAGPASASVCSVAQRSFFSRYLQRRRRRARTSRAGQRSVRREEARRGRDDGLGRERARRLDKRAVLEGPVRNGLADEGLVHAVAPGVRVVELVVELVVLPELLLRDRDRRVDVDERHAGEGQEAGPRSGSTAQSNSQSGGTH